MKTLADRAQAFLANPWHRLPLTAAERKLVEPGLRKHRLNLRKARRFTLDDGFTREAVAEASRPAYYALRRADLANLPFDSVWIECDQEVRLRTQLTLGTSKSREGREDRGIAGWLIVRRNTDHADTWTATPFASGRDPAVDDTEIGMCCQNLMVGASQAAVLAGDEDNESRMMLTMGWGYAGSDEEYISALPALVERGFTSPESEVFFPVIKMHIVDDGHGPTLMEARARQFFEGYKRHGIESRGDLRFLITVLAMVNHVPVRYVHKPASGRFTRRLNSMDYLDTHIVTLTPGRMRTRTILDRAVRQFEQSRRRAHEVRGHWMLATHGKGGRPGCSHLPISGDGDTCICGKCGGKLVWRDHHQRGDASLGFVKKEYEVTT